MAAQPQRPVAEPHKWVELTDTEIATTWAQLTAVENTYFQFARKLESLLREKNTKEQP